MIWNLIEKKYCETSLLNKITEDIEYVIKQIQDGEYEDPDFHDDYIYDEFDQINNNISKKGKRNNKINSPIIDNISNLSDNNSDAQSEESLPPINLTAKLNNIHSSGKKNKDKHKKIKTDSHVNQNSDVNKTVITDVKKDQKSTNGTKNHSNNDLNNNMTSKVTNNNDTSNNNDNNNNNDTNISKNNNSTTNNNTNGTSNTTNVTNNNNTNSDNTNNGNHSFSGNNSISISLLQAKPKTILKNPPHLTKTMTKLSPYNDSTSGIPPHRTPNTTPKSHKKLTPKMALHRKPPKKLHNNNNINHINNDNNNSKLSPYNMPPGIYNQNMKSQSLGYHHAPPPGGLVSHLSQPNTSNNLTPNKIHQTMHVPSRVSHNILNMHHSMKNNNNNNNNNNNINNNINNNKMNSDDMLGPFSRTLTVHEKNEFKMIQMSYNNRIQKGDGLESYYYKPFNPARPPACFPTCKPKIFDNELFYSRLDTSNLMLLFYFMPNSYEQYIASKYLHLKGWSFNIPYKQWFKRYKFLNNEHKNDINSNNLHENINTYYISNDNKFERGNYIYFDNSKHLWRIQTRRDFKFNYDDLEIQHNFYNDKTLDDLKKMNLGAGIVGIETIFSKHNNIIKNNINNIHLINNRHNNINDQKQKYYLHQQNHINNQNNKLHRSNSTPTSIHQTIRHSRPPPNLTPTHRMSNNNNNINIHRINYQHQTRQQYNTQQRGGFRPPMQHQTRNNPND